MLIREEAARHPLLQLWDFSVIFDKLGGGVTLLIPDGQVYRKARYGFGELYSVPCVQEAFNSGRVLSIGQIVQALRSERDQAFAVVALSGRNPFLYEGIKKLIKNDIFSVDGRCKDTRGLSNAEMVGPGAHYTRARVYSVESCNDSPVIELAGSHGRSFLAATRPSEEQTYAERIVYA